MNQSPRVATEQDATQRATEISYLARPASPVAVNGVPLAFDVEARHFVTVDGELPGLGDRFTIADLGGYLWQHRAAFNAAINARQPWHAEILGPRFAPGRIVATPGARDALATAGDEARTFLRRHLHGDWGDLCEEDRAANDAALVEGTRIFSAYHTTAGEKIWCITEWDRSYTTILLPSEY